MSELSIDLAEHSTYPQYKNSEHSLPCAMLKMIKIKNSITVKTVNNEAYMADSYHRINYARRKFR